MAKDNVVSEVCQVCHENGCQFLVQRGQQQDLIAALAARSPQTTWTGNAEQFVDSVINNLAEVDAILPDSLNRPLVERIRILLERANREAELAVKLRNQIERASGVGNGEG